MINFIFQRKQTLILFSLFFSHFFSANVLSKSKIQTSSLKNENTLFNIKKEPIKVVFKATGYPGFLKVKGESTKGLTGKIKKINNHLNGTLLFDLNSITTGISLRDKHMKEKYLKTKENPNALLHIDINLSKQHIKVIEFLQNKLEGKTITTTIPIKLTINGVEKNELSCDIRLEWKKTSIHVRSTLKTSLKNHKIPTPGYMGITLADEVNLDISFVLDVLPLKNEKKK